MIHKEYSKPYKLKLPTPSKELQTLVKLFSNSWGYGQRQTQQRKYLNNLTNSNSAAHDFVPYTVGPEAEQMNPYMKEYEEIFGESIVPILGIMRNVTTKPACIPPHLDKVKGASVNFVIESGGDNCTTVLYDKARTKNTEDVLFIDRDKVNSIGEYDLNNGWYVFDTQRVHSVENIISRRVVLTLMPVSEISMEKFILSYDHLICEPAVFINKYKP
tara:strand:+ start:1293 stop:1940 length:648 start_codon:yes stop_codon:yes gene_type:complete